MVVEWSAGLFAFMGQLDYIQQPEAGATAVQYAQDVLEDRIVAGRYVKLACKRFLDDIQYGAARGLVFSGDDAKDAVDFFGFLRHTKGVWAKKPETSGFVLSSWQVFILTNLFGWKKPAYPGQPIREAPRRYREAHLEVGRKNGKSTFIAGIGLFMLFADGEPGAEVYSAATTKDQAKIVFHAAWDMVRVSPALKARIGMWRNNLHVDISNSKFEPLASEANTLDGLNIHCALVDELHEHPTRALYDVLTTATGSRSQSLVLAITTAGFTREGICWDQRTYGIKVLQGVTPDDNFFAYIACLDEGDDWKDESKWIKANPNLGVSISLEAIRPNFMKAKEQPAAQNEFLRKHLNVWTSADTACFADGAWEKCCSAGEFGKATELIPAGIEKLRGIPLVTKVKDSKTGIEVEKTTYPQPRRCFGGLDIAECEDLVAFSLVFPPCDRVVRKDRDVKTGQVTESIVQEEDLMWSILIWYWIPQAFVDDREKKNRAPYGAWIRSKFVEVTEGNTVDQEAIRKKMLEINELFRVGEIGYDKWGCEWLAPKLLKDGLKMVPIAQRFELLSNPTKNFISFVHSGVIEHFNHPVLRWNASNVQLLMDSNGNVRPDKGKSKNKIDGIVATVMAVGRALANPIKGQDDPNRFLVRTL